MASFLSEEERRPPWGNREGVPSCELSEQVTRITGAYPHSRKWGGSGEGKSSRLLFQDVIGTGIIHHVTSLAGRTQRQCPGLRKEVTHCEPEETSASCLGSDLL